jgi:hypothetical protein
MAANPMGKQVGIAVDISDGNVIIQFEKEVNWLQLNPQQAVELAQAIAEKAMKLADRQGSQIIIPSHNRVLNS